MEESLLHKRQSIQSALFAIKDKISLFGALSKDQLNKIASLLESRSLKAGETVFKRGDPPCNIYIMRSGLVSLVFDVDDTFVTKNEFSCGDCFGEDAIIGIQPHSAMAIAATSSEVWVLSRHDLMAIAEDDMLLFSLLMMNIAREVSRRLYNTNEMFFNHLSQKKVSGLVAESAYDQNIMSLH